MRRSDRGRRRWRTRCEPLRPAAGATSSPSSHSQGSRMRGKRLLFVLTVVALGAGVADARAQKTVTNPDKSTTTTGPSTEHGSHTKESTSDADGRLTKEEFKDAKGRTVFIRYHTITGDGSVRVDDAMFADDGTPIYTETTITGTDGSRTHEVVRFEK